ncbi:MAG TPA: hypothetical protein VMZ29_13145 [Candidatus Bathyarchaeia archaeon]|nr:hypothetical protein [Candidatus Bathyarchaeia archaeon]
MISNAFTAMMKLITTIKPELDVEKFQKFKERFNEINRREIT